MSAALSIVVPAHNEERNLPRFFKALEAQDAVDRLQVVVVDNNSTDDTRALVEGYRGTLSVHYRTQSEPGVVPTRSAGVAAVLTADVPKTQFIACLDADTLVPDDFASKTLEAFRTTGADIISYPGSFPDDFYRRSPALTDAFLGRVGTIFFSEQLIRSEHMDVRAALFTEDLFADFPRPVSDSCLAFRGDSYERAGGYQREYFDDAETREAFAEGGRMLFRFEMLGMRHVYLRDVPHVLDPRRVLEYPDLFLTGKLYDDGMAPLSGVTDVDPHARLDAVATTIDFAPQKWRHIVDYYVLMRCVISPDRILDTPQYFVGISDDLHRKIIDWRAEHPWPAGAAVLKFGWALGDRFAMRIVENVAAFRGVPFAGDADVPVTAGVAAPSTSDEGER